MRPVSIDKDLSLHKVYHVWVAGDLNLPDINWDSSSATSDGQYSKISSQFLHIAHDHSLTQVVDEPTWTTEPTANILDLFRTNHPDMNNKHAVISGLSDHDIPFLDISTRIVPNKKSQRRVYLYKKGNMEGLVADLSDFTDRFCLKFSDQKFL